MSAASTTPSRPADRSPGADELVPLTATRRVKDGMTKQDVIASMRGKPDERVTPDIWVYWNFNDPKHKAADLRRPAMIVFFSAGRVSLLRISSEADIRATLAQHRHSNAGVAQK